MHKVTAVKTLENFSLAVIFDTGEERLFDMTPYLEKGVFKQLKNPQMFKQAYIAWDTVCWPNELDISPETLYLRSTPIEQTQYPSSLSQNLTSLNP